MPFRAEQLKPSKGSMIILALAVTLIVGLAIPRTPSPVVERPVSFEMDSEWNAVVKRAEVAVGSQVEPGTLVVVLTDPELEEEISRLETKLKNAQLETMEAVAQPGMLGSIGSVPRVIWETPAPESSPITVSPQKGTTTPISKLKAKDLTKFVKALESAESEQKSIEALVQEASHSLSQLEGEVTVAQTGFDEATKEQARMQRLYDLGAIPKRQLDEASTSADDAGVRLSDSKQKLAEAVARQELLEKQAVEQRAKTALARDALVQARQAEKQPSDDGEPSTSAAPPVTPTNALKPVKKVVYGTAPTSFAPVKVDLVESETPSETKSIEQIRSKLLGLKAKREQLKIRALRAGRVKWVVAPGRKVGIGDPLVQIEY